jgi:predicted ribosomally synthesized peptide with nif11-like leader
MTEEQLLAILAVIKNDVTLQDKFKSAPDLDSVLAIAKEAGIDINKTQASLMYVEGTYDLSAELSDEELERVAGGIKMPGWMQRSWFTYEGELVDCRRKK